MKLAWLKLVRTSHLSRRRKREISRRSLGGGAAFLLALGLLNGPTLGWAADAAAAAKPTRVRIEYQPPEKNVLSRTPAPAVEKAESRQAPRVIKKGQADASRVAKPSNEVTVPAPVFAATPTEATGSVSPPVTQASPSMETTVAPPPLLESPTIPDFVVPADEPSAPATSQPPAGPPWAAFKPPTEVPSTSPDSPEAAEGPVAPQAPGDDSTGTRMSISSSAPQAGPIAAISPPVETPPAAAPTTVETQLNPLRPSGNGSKPANFLRDDSEQGAVPGTGTEPPATSAASAAAESATSDEPVASESGLLAAPLANNGTAFAEPQAEATAPDTAQSGLAPLEEPATSQPLAEATGPFCPLEQVPHPAGTEDHLTRAKTVLHFVRMLGLSEAAEFGPPAGSLVPTENAPTTIPVPPAAFPSNDGAEKPLTTCSDPAVQATDQPTTPSELQATGALASSPSAIEIMPEVNCADERIQPQEPKDLVPEPLTGELGAESPPVTDAGSGINSNPQAGMLSRAKKLQSVLIRRQCLTAPAPESVGEPAPGTPRDSEVVQNTPAGDSNTDASSLSAHIHVPARQVSLPTLRLPAEKSTLPADDAAPALLSAAPAVETDALKPLPAALSRTSMGAGDALADASASVPAQLATPSPGNPVTVALPGSASWSEASLTESDCAQRLRIELRQSRLMRTGFDISRAESTDPRVCEVIQLSPREFAIIGKQPGVTRVDFWQEGPSESRESYVVLVGADSTELGRTRSEFSKLYESLRELYPHSQVTFTKQNGSLIVSGTARNKEEAIAIVTLVRRLHPIPVVDKLMAPR